jgi:phage N-6-adenine-methyltransferase
MLIGFRAKNHPQQVAKRGSNTQTDDRALPPEVFSKLHDRFRFTLDVAAAAHNAKLDRYCTREVNGLTQSWAGERVYCNPPFSNIEPWLVKAWGEPRAEIIVMLLPANRTEQGWWQRYIEPHRDKPGSPLRCEFIPGRIRFIAAGKDRVYPNERPPFGCCLCIWKYRPENI